MPCLTHSTLIVSITFFLLALNFQCTEEVDSCYSCTYRKNYKLRQYVTQIEQLMAINDACLQGSKAESQTDYKRGIEMPKQILENCINPKQSYCVKLSGTPLDSSQEYIVRGCINQPRQIGCRPVIHETLVIQNVSKSIYESWGCYCNNTNNCNGQENYEHLPHHAMYVKNCCSERRVWCIGTMLFIFMIFCLFNIMFPPCTHFIRRAYEFFTGAAMHGFNRM